MQETSAGRVGLLARLPPIRTWIPRNGPMASPRTSTFGPHPDCYPAPGPLLAPGAVGLRDGPGLKQVGQIGHVSGIAQERLHMEDFLHRPQI